MALITKTKIDSETLKNVVEAEVMQFLRESYYNLSEKNVDIMWEGTECVVNVHGNLTIQNPKLTCMTNGQFVFGNVTRRVDISYSNIETLEGCPTQVSGEFNCAYTQICDLRGLNVIKGNLVCTGCKKLVSLEDGPIYVGGCVLMEDCPNIKKFSDWSNTYIGGHIRMEGKVFNRMYK